MMATNDSSFVRPASRGGWCRQRCVALWPAMAAAGLAVAAGVTAMGQRIYQNRLTRIEHPKAVLGDHPRFVQPILENTHYEAPYLVHDPGADLYVRAWRFSMNARGIIEIPNLLKASETVVIIVHPWGINDGQGWRVPEPAGFAFGTPEKIAFTEQHLREVVGPFLKTVRDHVHAIMYSLPGHADAVRRKIYRGLNHVPDDRQRAEGRQALKTVLGNFSYRGKPIPASFRVSETTPVTDYFREFPGGLSGADYNGPGFWNLPIPVHAAIDVDPRDMVIYDAEGYDVLRDYLQKHHIRHVLLGGYRTTGCYRTTTAGYLNLEQDFNVFLVGDATLDNAAVNRTPRFATSAALAEASRQHLITQIGWIRMADTPAGTHVDTSLEPTHDALD